MLQRIARNSAVRPKLVLLITAVFFVLASVVGGSVIGTLNTDNSSFLDPNSESSEAAELFRIGSGLHASPTIIALIPADESETIAEVFSVLEADEEVGAVAGGPEMGEIFVSTDGKWTFVSATVKSEFDALDVADRLQPLLTEIDNVQVGGQGVLVQELNHTVERDLIRAELLAFPLLFIAALWVFRSAVAATLPLIVGGITIVTSLFIVRGIHEVVEISTFALNLITGLGLGLAIDYSLFIVSRYREELQRSGPGLDAILTTIATAGRTVVFSAVTVAGAGVALLVFPLRFLYSMGIGVTLVALVAAAVSIIVLPAVFALLGTRINAGALKSWHRAREAEARADNAGFWYRWSQFVMRYPIGIAALGTALLLGLGLPFLGVKFTGVDSTVLPETSESRIVSEALDNDFEGVFTPIAVAVEADEQAEPAVQELAAAMAELNQVELVLPPVYLGAEVWQVNVDTVGAALDDETLDLVDEIRALETPLDSVLVGGVTAEQRDQLTSLAGTIPLGLTILAILTIIALFVMTGSVILPVKAVIMNVLTISATFGVLVLIFQDGRLQGLLNYTSQGALESSQPVFIFAVVFGLSTDYAVFLLTRIKEARDNGAGERESVALGVQRTGRIVTAAAILFAIAVGAFATSDIVFLKQLGIGVALAVLIDAFIVRALLVPSLMALLGKYNWWAPKPLRALHQKIGVSEH